MLKIFEYILIYALNYLRNISPEVAPYLYKFTIHRWMEYSCHVWAAIPSYYLELLDKLQAQICRTVSFSVAASLEPLAHYWNVASLSFFCRYYFGNTNIDVLQNWLNWFHFLFLEAGSTSCSENCMIFLSPFLDVTWMSMTTVSFLAQLDSGILCLYNAFLWPII